MQMEQAGKISWGENEGIHCVFKGRFNASQMTG